MTAIILLRRRPMIEKLIDPERPYGEPAYSVFSRQISQLEQALSEQMTPQARIQLEQMADTYMRRETAALSDAFADGFWKGLELMLEFYQRNRT